MTRAVEAVHVSSLFIDGKWVTPSTTDRIEVRSASTGTPIGSVPHAGPADVDAAVAAARRAFDDPTGWRTWEPAARADALDRLAAEMTERAGQIAARVSEQNGMPISTAGQLEGGFPIATVNYYASLLRESITEETNPHMLGGTSTTRKEPIGVVAAIAAWNFPQCLAAFKYAPALAAGCTVVLKPSPETVLDSELLAQAAEAAGLPAGVLNIVTGGRETGAHLVQHPDVNKVAFTGSTGAGRAIAEVCGRLLRPVNLELGGKSAAIVLDDADLDLTVIGEKLFGATMLNNGQTCFLGTRILAPRRRYDEVVGAFEALVSALVVGDALDPATTLGPMVSAQHRDRVEGYIASGKQQGARLVTGGGRPAGLDAGWFVEPTVFADVDNSFTIAREEIFGPVLSIIPFDDDADAIRIANDSPYGLGGSVWTTDEDRGMDVARQIQTGTIGVNTYLIDMFAPFGGVKDSGFGRELGPGAMSAYQTVKTIFR